MPLIKNLTAHIIEIPLRHAFATSQDALARMVAHPVVIEVTLDDGRVAYGESAPVPYVTGETQETVLNAVVMAAGVITGQDVMRLRPLSEMLLAALPHSPTARAGIEMALYSAFSKIAGLPLCQLWGGAVDTVETDITLSMTPDAPERAEEAWEAGIRQFKLKVGSPNPEEDFQRLLAIQRAVPEGRLKVDANQGFTADSALRFISKAVDAGIHLELVEQPVPKADIAALNAVAVASPVPIFADEAVQTPADALRIVRETQVQGINVKMMKSGISGMLDIIAIARAANRKLMIGCMLESRRGIACSLAIACGTGAFDYVDLDSHLLLKEEGENPYFLQNGPYMTIIDKK
jgi:L-alanine-DL-glutamate epimerase-like enolase superfamily enzyme